MKDLCSRNESVPTTIWKSQNPRLKPSRWMLALRNDIAKFIGAPFMAPEMRMCELQCSSNFAGRWFYEKNGVGISLFPDEEIVHALIVHEAGGHWGRWILAGDEPGYHNEGFFLLMETLYAHFRVKVDTAKNIEGQYPRRWSGIRYWSDLKK